uniref:Uncharacterized protein n=1 Tax=Tanacetum cinerariifolium TaxID=118510 RepID=A0A699IFH2_TANCI|nr:hypothetical protein [Tanacetum cinerariifolium]
MSVKRTTWNEFSSSMALVVIYLATGKQDVMTTDRNDIVWLMASMGSSPCLNTRTVRPEFIKGNSKVLMIDCLSIVGTDKVNHTVEIDIVKLVVKIESFGMSADELDKELGGRLSTPEIIDLSARVVIEKFRVRKLEKKRRTKHSGLKKSRKVDTAHRVESSINIVVDDQEDASKQGEIAELDANEDVTLVDHAAVEKVLEVVTATKLITEVVTTAAPITTAAQVPNPSAPRRRRGVVIQDPKETAAAASVIVHLEVKPKDKGKGILIEEPKPLKGQAQIDIDEAFDNTVMRYQALKRKPLTEAQARKNMMIYLKNMAGFKMDFFKAKKQRIDEDAEDLKRHLQIIANDDDERFESIEPKNFSDDFLLNTLKIMFEKPNVEANIWRDQKSRYGLAKIHLEQMLNNVRLEVKEENEMSLKLLSKLCCFHDEFDNQQHEPLMPEE